MKNLLVPIITFIGFLLGAQEKNIEWEEWCDTLLYGKRAEVLWENVSALRPQESKYFSGLFTIKANVEEGKPVWNSSPFTIPVLKNTLAYRDGGLVSELAFSASGTIPGSDVEKLGLALEGNLGLTWYLHPVINQEKRKSLEWGLWESERRDLEAQWKMETLSLFMDWIRTERELATARKLLVWQTVEHDSAIAMAEEGYFSKEEVEVQEMELHRSLVNVEVRFRSLLSLQARLESEGWNDFSRKPALGFITLPQGGEMILREYWEQKLLEADIDSQLAEEGARIFTSINWETLTAPFSPVTAEPMHSGSLTLQVELPYGEADSTPRNLTRLHLAEAKRVFAERETARLLQNMKNTENALIIRIASMENEVRLLQILSDRRKNEEKEGLGGKMKALQAEREYHLALDNLYELREELYFIRMKQKIIRDAVVKL